MLATQYMIIDTDNMMTQLIYCCISIDVHTMHLNLLPCLLIIQMDLPNATNIFKYLPIAYEDGTNVEASKNG